MPLKQSLRPRHGLSRALAIYHKAFEHLSQPEAIAALCPVADFEAQTHALADEMMCVAKRYRPDVVSAALRQVELRMEGSR